VVQKVSSNPPAYKQGIDGRFYTTKVRVFKVSTQSNTAVFTAGDIVKALVSTGPVDFVIQSISFWGIGDGSSRTYLNVTLNELGASTSEYNLEDWGNGTFNAGAKIFIPAGKQVSYRNTIATASTTLATIRGNSDVVADFHLIWRPSA